MFNRRKKVEIDRFETSEKLEVLGELKNCSPPILMKGTVLYNRVHKTKALADIKQTVY